MHHYYFKFMEQNDGLKKWIKKYNSENSNIELSIYYGEWKIEEYNTYNFSKMHKKSYNQVVEFFSLNQKQNHVYFWIFYEQYIYCFQSFDLKVRNGPNYLISYHKDGTIDSYPKSIIAKLHSKYEKKDLPEFFSNLNSNQKYNRGTICELSNTELEFAKSLISNNRIEITRKNYLKYLSPIEFETLIYEIIMRTGSLCSSFRGGTLKDYDLRVKILNNKLGLPNGEYWLQLKKQETKILPQNNMYIIHTGKTDLNNRIIGNEWINKNIENNQQISMWLKNMTFNYKTYNFNW